MINVFDNKIAEMKREILNLQQTKQKDISQIKFGEFVLENVELNSIRSKRYMVSPLNDVVPLITARVELLNDTVDNVYLEMGKSLSGGKYRFVFGIFGASPHTTARANITFVSTSQLNIEED